MRKDLAIPNNQEKKFVLMEGNLLENPVFSMARARGKNEAETIWLEKNILGQIITERKFKVICPLGIPNFYDMDVLNGIMSRYGKIGSNYKINEVHLTAYKLIKEVGLPIHSGKTIKDVKGSLMRMVATTLAFEKTFYKENEKITKAMHLLSGVSFYEKKKGSKTINMIKVTLDNELISSIDRKYFKLIDFDMYHSLTPGLPRRLYAYLEKKKYGKSQFEIGIVKLAMRLPLKTSQFSHLRKLLEKASNELKEKTAIDDWQFKNDNIIFYFAKAKKYDPTPADIDLEKLAHVFYTSIGKENEPSSVLRKVAGVFQDLINDGYTRADVAYAVKWAPKHIKGIYSAKIIPNIIGEALSERDRKKADDAREKAERQRRTEDQKMRENDIKKGEAMDKAFARLPLKKRTAIEDQARQNLIKNGIAPEYIRGVFLRIERNRLLEAKKGK